MVNELKVIFRGCRLNGSFTDISKRVHQLENVEAVTAMNIILNTFCDTQNELDEVVASFKADGVEPNVVTMTSLLKFCNNLTEAERIVASFKADGVEPDVVTMNSLCMIVIRNWNKNRIAISQREIEFLLSLRIKNINVRTRILIITCRCMAHDIQKSMHSLQNLIQSGVTLNEKDLYNIALVVTTFFPENSPLRTITLSSLIHLGHSDIVFFAEENRGKFSSLISDWEKSLEDNLRHEKYGGGTVWDDVRRYGVNSLARRGVLT